MMNPALRGLMVAAVSLSSLSAFATVYSDSIGDLAVGTFPHIDIASVTVTNTATDVTFRIGLNGSPLATNWGKYNIVMRAGGAVDAADKGNGWGRPYKLEGGANRFIGGWADQSSNNAELWSFAGGAWSKAGDNFTSTITDTSVSYTASLAALGLSPGGSLVFDVVTTGGGGNDGAVDALSNPNAQITDWGQQSTVAGVTYTVAPVPEPASVAALGIGAATLLRRRRK